MQKERGMLPEGKVRGETQALSARCSEAVQVHLCAQGLRKAPLLLGLKLRAPVLRLQAPLGCVLDQHPSPRLTSVSVRPWTSSKLP